jgi:hypothetical protein
MAARTRPRRRPLTLQPVAPVFIYSLFSCAAILYHVMLLRAVVGLFFRCACHGCKVLFLTLIAEESNDDTMKGGRGSGALGLRMQLDRLDGLSTKASYFC